ncbi:hypothetical protein AaE_002535 [Aphanomyces astaci]|uniref:RanBP2-type domain-containing protein n=1 Tax=Aphanomyces astaci TaxID=112090 RepID=A0A6A5APK1_APHAT|nr:hypothetical protein AaE_002535 [Aphanomyces astaci]
MMGGGPPPRLGTDGDWVCPKEGCGNINFARRMECNRCFTPRVDAPKKPFGDRQFGGEKKTGLFGPSDWACGKCGNMNWERRNECNICKAPKASLGPDEKRDGAGGGFNERQERVASGRREVAEDGYDDFGQRRQKAPVSQADREAAALARLKASYSAMYTNERISHSVGGDDEDFARKPPTSSRRSPDRPIRSQSDAAVPSQAGGEVQRPGAVARTAAVAVQNGVLAAAGIDLTRRRPNQARLGAVVEVDRGTAVDKNS